ncbi:Ddt domain superfamily [Thalictrum thalictroides]|uniref:Ddt domain superfamily n=1 Tax=Thalictrum thalictroides TaxID=46969 RepID=A0A7J6XDW5_THATH|nr:Ddt domain superfamily [Thalictrum thalictroides]
MSRDSSASLEILHSSSSATLTTTVDRSRIFYQCGKLASVLNFLNVFRWLLKFNVEFSAEELETALLTSNSTIDDIHSPLLKEDI